MFDKILRYFVQNARINYMLFFLVIILGIWSYGKMAKEIFPSFDLDVIVVNGHYNGASVDTLNKIIVQELENDLKSVVGVDTISTIIKSGTFSIVLELTKSTNRYNTLLKVKDIVDVSKGNLPSDMDDPIVKTVDLNKKLLEVVVTSDTYSLDRLKQEVQVLKNKLLDIKDISEVTIYGDSDKFYEIVIDDKKVESYDLNPNDIYNSLQTLSYIYPLGKIEDNKKHYALSTYNGAKTQNELQNTQISIAGKSLYLKDIAIVKQKYEDTDTLFSLDGSNGINMVLNQNKSGDAMSIEKDVQKVIKSFNAKNSNIEYKIVDNQSYKIKERLNIVVSNILLGLIVITLIVIVLINARMSFIIMIGIPTSFVIASILFYTMGYTINLISLVGVLLALGIIVDDAIVVSEHIQQYVEDGVEPKEAAIKGASEMVKPVTIASLTTLFAFLPSLMISGTMGEVIKLIPIAMSALVVASLIETFIFLPIHAAHTLKKDAKVLSWEKANAVYSGIIHFFMRWKKSFLIIFIFCVPFLSFMIIKSSHFQMFPTFDSTIVNVAVKAQVDTTVEQSNVIVKQITKEILTQKEKWSIKNISSIAGFRRDSGGNTETYPYVMSIAIELNQLKAQNFVDRYITPNLSFYYDDVDKKRALTSQEVSNELKLFLKQKQFKAQYNLMDLSVVQKKVGPIKADIKMGLISSNTDKIHNAIKKLQNKLKSIDGVISAANSTNLGVEELKIKVNKYGESLGIDEGYIGKIVANQYLNIKKTSIFTQDGVLDLKVQSLYKDDLENFKMQNIVLKDGTSVTLNQVCDFITVRSFEKIIKENGVTNFYIFSNVDTKIITASEVLTKIEPLLEEFRKDGIKIILKGEAQKNEELKQDMKFATTIALILILIAILYLFNSFRDTFIVMSVIPFSLLGVLVGHQIMGINLGMTTFIGALGLSGVVVNDGIIMMTYLKKAENIQDVFISAAKRFRPIILTTVTTLIGISSLIFFPTGQAVLFQPMAIALGFGLAWGTVLNLIYLPVLYVLVNKKIQ